MTLIWGVSAVYHSGQTINPSTHYLDSMSWENLPNGTDVRGCFPELTDQRWNDLVHLISKSAEMQTFGEPYLWQRHEKMSFARWLRSWRI